MKNSVENHLRPIINNVVDNYPFYNRSYGHDHFLIYPYDFGVLCSGRHLREDWSERVINIFVMFQGSLILPSLVIMVWTLNIMMTMSIHLD